MSSTGRFLVSVAVLVLLVSGCGDRKGGLGNESFYLAAVRKVGVEGLVSVLNIIGNDSGDVLAVLESPGSEVWYSEYKLVRDVDGDGGDDIVAVLEPEFDSLHEPQGQVVLMSASGDRIREWSGSGLPVVLSEVGGVRVWARSKVGIRGSGGGVAIESVVDGTEKLFVPSPDHVIGFGYGIEEVGDLSGDGLRDLAVLSDSSLFFVSRADGRFLGKLSTGPSDAWSGASVCYVGNGRSLVSMPFVADQQDSILVVDDLEVQSGFVFGGADYLRGYAFRMFGVGDVDGDGYGDCLVWTAPAGKDGCLGLVVSGASLETIYVMDGGRRYDSVPSLCGDIDLDGVVDFCVVSGRSIVLVSGGAGRLLQEVKY